MYGKIQSHMCRYTQDLRYCTVTSISKGPVCDYLPLHGKCQNSCGRLKRRSLCECLQSTHIVFTMQLGKTFTWYIYFIHYLA